MIFRVPRSSLYWQIRISCGKLNKGNYPGGLPLDSRLRGKDGDVNDYKIEIIKRALAWLGHLRPGHCRRKREAIQSDLFSAACFCIW